MTIDELFTAYYSQYRSEATIPESTSITPDDEYTIFLRLANEAISRWASYDNTYWKELFTTLALSGETTTIQTGVTDYDAPDDFAEAGGFIKANNASGFSVEAYKIIEPQQVQFQGESSNYAFFTGSPADGYTLHLNPAPASSLNGLSIDYVYYKSPTLATGGSDTPEMTLPYFIVHRALWSRFRGSRNPFSDEAKSDAEDVLRTMQMTNNSGNWANPWAIADNSGSQFGG